VSSAVQYLGDIPPYPTVSILSLAFPTTRSAILSEFRDHLRSLPRSGPSQKIVAVIDGIISNPGILLPWKEMVTICKEEGVWSVIDAAHSIGQEVGINLGEAKPDFWVSVSNIVYGGNLTCDDAFAILPRIVTNGSSRSEDVPCCTYQSGLLQVDSEGTASDEISDRNRHIIKSTIPTSNTYVSPSGSPDLSSLLAQFECMYVSYSCNKRILNMCPAGNGTVDFVPYLSVRAALDFREWLGGEEKINAYCHSLALSGGKRLAEVLGTRVMDEVGDMTANMVHLLPMCPNMLLLTWFRQTYNFPYQGSPRRAQRLR
jgi:hercynylcysteine S-oxide lyase